VGVLPAVAVPSVGVLPAMAVSSALTLVFPPSDMQTESDPFVTYTRGTTSSLNEED